MLTLGYLITLTVAYLLGSIPTGFLVAKGKGVDIRAVGSGNIGATNVFRAAGIGPGIFVFAVDALKGFVACEIIAGLGSWIARLGFRWMAAMNTSPAAEYFPIIAGFAAVLGHNFTCWLGFKGGKGIATSAGVLLALFPKALLAVVVIWILVFAIGRYVSLASVMAALWLSPFVWYFGYSRQRLAIAIIMTVLAVYKHRSNIQRLVAGTEHRFAEKNPPPETPTPATE